MRSRSIAGDQNPALASARALMLASIFLASSTANLAAQGLPVDTGSHIPVALWFIGAILLGLVMAWAILYNRKRTRAQRQLTEQATRENYRQEEERERIRSRAE